MKKVISGSLVLILVAVTVGVPIFRHTCHVFDRSEISLLFQESCCDPGDSRGAAKLDVQCCSLEQFTTSLDYETLVEKSMEIASSLPVGEISFTYQAELSHEKESFIPVPRPPPTANRALLNKIQQYLI